MKSKNLFGALWYIDTTHPNVGDFSNLFHKSVVSQILDLNLTTYNPETGASSLSQRGKNLMEKYIENRIFSDSNSYRFSIFNVLCAILMLVISAIHLLGMFIDFETNFVAVEAFAIIDVQYMLLQLPRNLCICLGSLLYWVSIGLGNRKLSLASVILFVCSFFCWPSIYIGVACIPVFVLGIIGYVRSGRS